MWIKSLAQGNKETTLAVSGDRTRYLSISSPMLYHYTTALHYLNLLGVLNGNCHNLLVFSMELPQSLKGSHWNCLIETIQMSTHNIQFDAKIHFDAKKINIILNYHFLLYISLYNIITLGGGKGGGGGGRGRIYCFWCGSRWLHTFLSTISCEPVVGFLPNIHVYFFIKAYVVGTYI